MRGSALKSRGAAWVARQEAYSRKGVAIGAWQRYRDVEGPLQSLLLTTYTLIAVIPALLVMVEYIERKPAAFAGHVVKHFDLSHATAVFVRGVLVADASHKLWSAAFAIAGALVFGLNFGKVLQLVNLRTWQVELESHQGDQTRYGLVLLALYGLFLLLFLQEATFGGRAGWVGWVLTPLWVALLVGYFLWTPWILLHRIVGWRELLPGAVLTAVSLVLLMAVSSFVMEYWIDFYARDYGGFGVVMAIFFWIGLSSSAIIWSAALGPALAVRRGGRTTISTAP